MSDGPVAVSVSPKGEHYLLDGYHRVVSAQRNGVEDIAVKNVPWSPTIAKRYKQDIFK